MSAEIIQRKGGTGAMSNTGGSVQIIRGNALDLPLPDASVLFT